MYTDPVGVPCPLPGVAQARHTDTRDKQSQIPPQRPCKGVYSPIISVGWGGGSQKWLADLQRAKIGSPGGSQAIAIPAGLSEKPLKTVSCLSRVYPREADLRDVLIVLFECLANTLSACHG